MTVHKRLVYCLYKCILSTFRENELSHRDNCGGKKPFCFVSRREPAIKLRSIKVLPVLESGRRTNNRDTDLWWLRFPFGEKLRLVLHVDCETFHFQTQSTIKIGLIANDSVLLSLTKPIVTSN